MVQKYFNLFEVSSDFFYENIKYTFQLSRSILALFPTQLSPPELIDVYRVGHVLTNHQTGERAGITAINYQLSLCTGQSRLISFPVVSSLPSRCGKTYFIFQYNSIISPPEIKNI